MICLVCSNCADEHTDQAVTTERGYDIESAIYRTALLSTNVLESSTIVSAVMIILLNRKSSIHHPRARAHTHTHTHVSCHFSFRIQTDDRSRLFDFAYIFCCLSIYRPTLETAHRSWRGKRSPDYPVTVSNSCWTDFHPWEGVSTVSSPVNQQNCVYDPWSQVTRQCLWTFLCTQTMSIRQTIYYYYPPPQSIKQWCCLTSVCRIQRA